MQHKGVEVKYVFCERHTVTNIANVWWKQSFAFLMENKLRGKWLIIRHSEKRKFLPKMRQNTFGEQAPPGSAGRA